MNMQNLKAAISEAVAESHDNGYGRAEWTKCIKRKIVEYAKKEGLYSCAAGVDNADWGEWLYDLTILKYYDNDSNSDIESTELVLESEWDTDDLSIIVDFQKLLLANAKLKVMIYYQNTNVLETLKKAVWNYRTCNGEFLITFIRKEDLGKAEFIELNAS